MDAPTKSYEQIAREQQEQRAIEDSRRIVQELFESLEVFRTDVCDLLLLKQRNKATELVVAKILTERKIYTTRDDEKSEMWIYNEGIYIPQGKTFIREFCRLVLKDVFTTQFCNEVISKIEADTYIDSASFFAHNDKTEIAVQNGILNLETGTLTAFTPAKIFFNKVPVTFNAEKNCPQIEKHFKEVLKHEQDAIVMFEVFGSLLYKENKWEKSIMFLGEGRNGKGKTIELMKRFVGIENCSNVSLHQMETDIFAASELFGKMANLSGDLDKHSLHKTGMFKQLTGRDLIAAPRKFLRRINFVNYAKFVFACNSLPRTDDKTTAFWNRWVIFEFPYTFLTQEEIAVLPELEKAKAKVKDPDIVEKMATPEELSGLLNKALLALKNLLKNQDYSNSCGVDAVKRLWIQKSDSFLAFAVENLNENPDARIEKMALRRAYNAYCKANKLMIQADKQIKHTLEENFVAGESRNHEGTAFWEGLEFAEKKEKKEAENNEKNEHGIVFEKSEKNLLGIVLPKKEVDFEGKTTWK